MKMWRQLILVLALLTNVIAEQIMFLDDVMQPVLPPNSKHLLVTFDPALVDKLNEESITSIDVWSKNKFQDFEVIASSSDAHVAGVTAKPLIFETYNSTHFKTTFNITGEFLGYSYVFLQVLNKSTREANVNATQHHPDDAQQVLQQSPNIRVAVIRTPRLIDRIFIISVATLVSLIYVNFGCALNWDVVKATLKRPIGPVIGFISQFVFMPLISYFLGRFLFPGQTAMQLGMFFTGCSPGGGASNIWTVALGGNLDLSITMTSISTFASFVMVPLWVFTLGRVIFEEGRLGVPYSKITTVAAGLLIPLLIGILIQQFLPKLAKLLVRLMKPFAVFLILFIVIFGILTNLYLFSLLNWKILLGGMFMPWLGYMFGALFAHILRQSGQDIIAIAVETGVQNTGISIYLLRFALGQPEADLAQVCPVAVSLMTPWPLALLSIWRCRQKQHKQGVVRLPSTELTTPTLEQVSNTQADKF